MRNSYTTSARAFAVCQDECANPGGLGIDFAKIVPIYSNTHKVSVDPGQRLRSRGPRLGL